MPRSEVEAIAAFGAFAAGVEEVVLGELDDLGEASTGAFAGAAGGDVVGVARNPEGVDALPAGKGEEQSDGAAGILVAARGGVHIVADMPEVGFDIAGMPDAEVDSAGDLDGRSELGAEAHPEVVGGDEPLVRVGVLAAKGKLADEAAELFTGQGGMSGDEVAGAGVVEGFEQSVDPAILWGDQFQLAIYQEAGVEEAELFEEAHGLESMRSNSD